MTTKRRIATVLAAASLMLSALAAPAFAGPPSGVPGSSEDSPDEGGACDKLADTNNGGGKDCDYPDDE